MSFCYFLPNNEIKQPCAAGSSIFATLASAGCHLYSPKTHSKAAASTIVWCSMRIRNVFLEQCHLALHSKRDQSNKDILLPPPEFKSVLHVSLFAVAVMEGEA